MPETFPALLEMSLRGDSREQLMRIEFGARPVVTLGGFGSGADVVVGGGGLQSSLTAVTDHCVVKRLGDEELLFLDEPHDEVTLRDGELVTIGARTFRFFAHAPRVLRNEHMERAVREHPDDRSHWLVYADWLSQQRPASTGHRKRDETQPWAEVHAGDLIEVSTGARIVVEHRDP